MNTQLTSSLLLVLLAACSGGGGGGGGTTGPIQPPAPTPTAPSALASGIVAVAAGAGAVRLDVALPGPGFEAALFSAPGRAAVYGGAPLQAVAASPVMLSGLVDGTDVHFGLAIRATGASAWTPVGVAVRARPAAPIYVDAAAPAAGADGLSPATAFPSLLDAMLVAGARNEGNVWVKNGDYGPGPLPLGSNVHVAGGFGAAFTLASRDVATQGTRVAGSTGLTVFDVVSGGGDGSLDGMVVDGLGAVTEGVDVTDSDIELRSLVVRNCSDRGVRAKVTLPQPNRMLQVVACTVTGNGSDGLSSAGPIDVRLDQCRFDANGQEGCDIDDLQAPSGGAVALAVTACRFYGNVFEGLDCDLSAAPGFTAPGTFAVRVENSAFERNGLDGLLIDQDHELAPGFAATIAILGCSARANRLAGVHVDADAEGTYRLDRLRCCANAGDGIQVTGETNAGEVVITAAWSSGNLGYGLFGGTGNKTLVATHCAFAGNQLGGVHSDGVPAAVADCVFAGQATPLGNALAAGTATAAAADDAFTVAPTAFAAVTAHTQGTLTVADTSAFAVGTRAVVADDGTRRLVAQQTATTVVLDTVPAAFPVPGAVAAYATDAVVDDLRLPAGSPAIGSGLAAAGGTPVDGGPHGVPAGGEPGHVEPTAAPTLQLLRTLPALATGVTALQPLELEFDRAIDPGSVLAERIGVTAGAAAVAVNVQITGNRIVLAPTAAGWSGADRVVVHLGVAGSDGSPLGAPLLLPIRLL
ncbi:MAG: right-handed parallel beta-helix repeat-containing protein [Planctomycetota bacterium]